MTRLRAALTVFFALDGFVFANWVVRIPAVKAQTGASAAALGLALLCPSVGAIATMTVTGALCRRLGSGRVTAAAATALSLTVMLPPLARSPAELGLALTAFGIAYGGLNVAMNAVAVDLVAALRRPVMPGFHAAWSFGGLSGAGIGGLLAPHLPPFPHLALAAAASLLATALAARALLVPAACPIASPSHRRCPGGCGARGDGGREAPREPPPRETTARAPAHPQSLSGTGPRSAASRQGMPASTARHGPAAPRGPAGASERAPGAGPASRAGTRSGAEGPGRRADATAGTGAGSGGPKGDGAPPGNGAPLESSAPLEKSRAPLGSRVALFGLIALCAAYSEGAIADWSALHLRQDLGASASLAATGYAAFALAEACGRLSGTALLARFGQTRVLVGGGLVAGAGALAAALAPAVPVALTGFAATGLGVANMFPAAMTRAGLLAGPGGVAAASTLGYAGFLLGPPAIGFLASEAGLPAGLTTIALLALIAVALALFAKGDRVSQGGAASRGGSAPLRPPETLPRRCP